MKNKRFLKNLLIRPHRQLRFAIYNTLFSYLLVLFAVLSTQIINFITVKSALSGESIDPSISEHILESLLKSIAYPTFLILMLMCVSFFILVKMSHQFFGPIVPIRSVLDQLKQGHYGVTRKLRQGDELVEVMDSVNELSKTLEQRYGKK